MLAIFIKYFSLFFCGLYFSTHIADVHIKKTSLIGLPILLSLIILIANQLCPNQYFYFPLIMYVFFNYLYIKNPRYAFMGAILSYGSSYALSTFSTFIASTLLYLVHPLNYHQSLFIMCLLSNIIAITITLLLFKIPRFKSGMPFLFQGSFSLVGILFSILMIFSDIYTHIISVKHLFTAFLIQLLACLLLIPFIAWWRSQLTKSYRQYLRDSETQELRAKVQQLSADNQRLSQIVHKDNKLITAMTSSVLGLVEQATSYSPDHLSAYSDSLYQELLSLSSHRQDSLQQLSGNITGQFHTGYMMLDSILNLQAKQAMDSGISFSAEYTSEFFSNIFAYIDEEQLTHIVADLVQNAVIATKNSNAKNINVSFVSNAGTPSIQISDTGVSFPIIVLDSLGQERCSQHLNDGGSGIGLMDIWALKNTAKATLLIEEFPDDASFTKRIHLIFDSKNRYLVMSDRKNELTSHLHRPDVVILAPSK